MLEESSRVTPLNLIPRLGRSARTPRRKPAQRPEAPCHNDSQGFHLYSHEPGGNRVGVYSGSYLVFAPDWEVVTLNEEDRGRGVYWRSPLPDSLINNGTPDVAADKASAPRVPVFEPI